MDYCTGKYRQSPGGGGVLDQILDGDVPSRFQKHTRSLYQFFQNVYPTLYQFFKNIYPTLYQFSENGYRIQYQLRKSRKVIPFLTKFVKIDTVPYTKIVKIDTLPDGTSPRTQNMYSTPPPGAKQGESKNLTRLTGYGIKSNAVDIQN